MNDYESNDFDEDTTHAQWDQLAREERWQREDEALKRHGKLLEDFRRKGAAFDQETEAFNERMREYKHGNHCI